MIRTFQRDDDLSIIGDVSNLRILELGAGAANCSLALAGKGAKVTCLDISITQLVAGSESASRLGFENEVTSLLAMVNSYHLSGKRDLILLLA